MRLGGATIGILGEETRKGEVKCGGRFDEELNGIHIER